MAACGLCGCDEEEHDLEGEDQICGGCNQSCSFEPEDDDEDDEDDEDDDFDEDDDEEDEDEDL